MHKSYFCICNTLYFSYACQNGHNNSESIEYHKRISGSSKHNSFVPGASTGRQYDASILNNCQYAVLTLLHMFQYQIYLRKILIAHFGIIHSWLIAILFYSINLS